MRLEIEFRAKNIGLMMCDCNKPATLAVFCPPSDYAQSDDGFVCYCCEFCKPSAVRMIDKRPLLPIVAA